MERVQDDMMNDWMLRRACNTGDTVETVIASYYQVWEFTSLGTYRDSSMAHRTLLQYRQ